MKKICLVLILFCLMGCRFEFSTPEAELKAVLGDHIDGMNNGDVVEAMEPVDKTSPFYDQMYMMLESIGDVYQLEISLDDFEYVGTSEDNAIVVIKQRTVKVEGPDFRDNAVRSLVVFRKVDEEWKIWQSLTLAVEYIDEAAG